MRSHFSTALILIACCSLLNDRYFISEQFYSEHSNAGQWGGSIADFTVQRLSGERVMITWHTEDEAEPVRFEVMRKHGDGQAFTSLGIVQPLSKKDNFVDYSFIDINDFPDSSFYRLKKTDADSVVFFSIKKGVEGFRKQR